MFTLILRLAWPHLMRFATSQAADYLESRRQRSLEGKGEPQAAAECPPCPPCPPGVAASESSTGNTIWFALSGVMLGSAVSLMLYLILQDNNARAQT